MNIKNIFFLILLSSLHISAFNPYGSWGGGTWPSWCGWTWAENWWSVYSIHNTTPYNFYVTPHGFAFDYYSPQVGSPLLAPGQSINQFSSPNCKDYICALTLWRLTTGQSNEESSSVLGSLVWSNPWNGNNVNNLYIGMTSAAAKSQNQGTGMVKLFDDIQLYLNTTPPSLGPLLFLQTINNNTGQTYLIFGTTAPLINGLSSAQGSGIVIDANSAPSIVNELNTTGSAATSFILNNIYSLGIDTQQTLTVGGTQYQVYPGNIYEEYLSSYQPLASASAINPGYNSYKDILVPNIISGTSKGIQTLILIPQNSTTTCAPVYFIGKDNHNKVYALAVNVNQVVNANSCCCSATQTTVTPLTNSNCTYSCPNDQIQSSFTQTDMLNLASNYSLTLTMNWDSSTFTSSASLTATQENW